MEIIPAIDICKGQVVRLEQGSFEKKTKYEVDPASMARRFAQEGATRLHVVDLDGARSGKTQNKKTVMRIVDSVDIPVQVSGGIRRFYTAVEYRNFGANRVIVGTTAVNNPATLERMTERLGEALVVSVDARNGIVATDGWEQSSRMRALPFIESLERSGVRRIVYTDIARDGMLQGPNFAEIHRVSRHLESLPSRPQLIASGGVSSLEDLKRLRDLGIEGVIVGKALYSKKFDLHDALRVAA
jgi:phosphoribosylformimino-5-aminoimidazole carboxamide ribotide isomerase